MCLPLDDGICDPDCDIDVDPNCALDITNITNLSQTGTVIILEAKIKNFLNQTINQISWNINNGEINESSTINFTLQSQEDIFIYHQYNYSTGGNYTIVFMIENGTLMDSEELNLTIS